jgi:hypothetical protein
LLGVSFDSRHEYQTTAQTPKQDPNKTVEAEESDGNKDEKVAPASKDRSWTPSGDPEPAENSDDDPDYETPSANVAANISKGKGVAVAKRARDEDQDEAEENGESKKLKT